MNTASNPVFTRIEIASCTVFTTGSPCLLNEVFKTIGTPVN